MKGKKGGILETAVIFFACFLILLTFIVFLNMEKSHNKFVIEKVSDEVGDNLFLLGILRTEIKDVQISELLARYVISNDSAIKTIVSNRINEVMQSLYSKNVCWKMTFPKRSSLKPIKDGISDCENLKYEKISAQITLPGYNQNTFDVKFETP